MQRFLSLVLFLLALGFANTAASQPVRGLIVRLQPAANPQREQPQAARERLTAVLRDTGMTATHRGVGSAHHLVRLDGPQQGEALESTMRRLRLHPDVLSVEPDVRQKLLKLPNDPGFAQQWHLAAPTVSAVSAINMPAAWDRSTGGPVVVAVLDTGVLKGHPDLADKLLAGYDFVSEVEYANDGNGRDDDPSDPGDWIDAADTAKPLFSGCPVADSSWHGTFIAAQIAASSNNGVGVAGVSWGAMVLPLRVSGKCGALLSDILDAMRWAAGLSVDGVPDNPSPARIINLSFGGDAPCSESYQSVIDEVTARGTLVVVAAGNDDGGQLKRPADCRRVLAVGAVRSDGRKADYSNIGPGMGLMAPGGDTFFIGPTDIYSATSDGLKGPGSYNYSYKRGTSFSAPLAAGVASLMLSVNPALTPATLISRLRGSTRPFVALGRLCSNDLSVNHNCSCTTDTCGAGMLDGALALGDAYRPNALATAPASAAPGSAITLDGRTSSAATGATLTSYLWTQVSGPSVVIRDATTSLASLTLPGTTGSLSFKLTVTDSAALSSESVVTVEAATAAAGGGGGADGLWWGLLLWSFTFLLWWRRRHVQPQR